jgi:hypothetical protein
MTIKNNRDYIQTTISTKLFMFASQLNRCGTKPLHSRPLFHFPTKRLRTSHKGNIQPSDPSLLYFLYQRQRSQDEHKDPQKEHYTARKPIYEMPNATTALSSLEEKNIEALFHDDSDAEGNPGLSVWDIPP